MSKTPKHRERAGSNPTDPNLGDGALHAPWRLTYLESLKESENQSKQFGDNASFLRHYWNTPDNDVQNHVIMRNAHGMILLNAYPYANGHLLVALGDPRPTLLDYQKHQRSELWSLVETATELIHRALEPQGVNIGINQGRAAGAGVPQHLHVHLVPRWSGDTNFMTVVGKIRVIPAALEHMADCYRTAWKAMGESRS